MNSTNDGDRSAFARRASADKSVERLLRQPVGDRYASSAAGDCVDAETLAAWSAGSLPPIEASAVERHVSECSRCEALLASFVRTAPIAPSRVGPTHASPLRWHARWLVPLATAATVAAIWVALPADRPMSDANVVAELQVAEQKPAPVQPIAEPPPATAPSENQSLRANREAVGQVASQTGSASASKPTVQTESAFANQPTVPPAAGAVTRDTDAMAVKPLLERGRNEADQRRDQKERAPQPAEFRSAQKAREESAVTDIESALFEIVSPNRSHRWRIAVAGVEYSATAGAKWQRVSIQPPALLTIGHSPAPGVAWLVGPEGAIYVTTNGSQFARVPFIEKIDLVSVEAIDDRQASVTSADGRTFRTADRGATWTSQEIQTAPF